MGIRIHDLEPADGSNKRGKRKARGIGGKGGKTVTVQKRQTPKDIERGPSDAEFEAKFHKLAARTLDEPTRAAMLKTIWNIDKAKRVDDLVTLTAV